MTIKDAVFAAVHEHGLVTVADIRNFIIENDLPVRGMCGQVPSWSSISGRAFELWVDNWLERWNGEGAHSLWGYGTIYYGRTGNHPATTQRSHG